MKEKFPFADRPRGGFRFTPFMSVVIGIVSALFIVACVVAAALRLQCSRNQGRRKRLKFDQRTRSTSGSLCAADKPPSPCKLDPQGDSGGDSDEKNPDVIPQPIGGKYTNMLLKL